MATIVRYTLLISAVVLAPGCQSGPLGGLAWSPFTKQDRTSYQTPAMRAEAATQLAAQSQTGDAGAQQTALTSLATQIQTEPDPLVREAIVRSVARFSQPLAQEIVQAGLQDEDAFVRQRCCQLLGDRQATTSVAALKAVMLQDEEADVRIAATQALGELKTAEAQQALVAALEHQDPAMQFAGVEAVQSMTGREFDGNVRACLAYAKGESLPAETPQVATRPESKTGIRAWVPFF